MDMEKMCPMCPACLHTHSMATAKPGNNQYYHLNGLQGIDCALGLGGWQLLVGPSLPELKLQFDHVGIMQGLHSTMHALDKSQAA